MWDRCNFQTSTVPDSLEPAASLSPFYVHILYSVCAHVCCSNRTKDPFVQQARGFNVSSTNTLCAACIFMYAHVCCPHVCAHYLSEETWARVQCVCVPVECSFSPRAGLTLGFLLFVRPHSPFSLPWLWSTRLLLQQMLILLLTAPSNSYTSVVMKATFAIWFRFWRKDCCKLTDQTFSLKYGPSHEQQRQTSAMILHTLLWLDLVPGTSLCLLDPFQAPVPLSFVKIFRPWGC